MVTMTRAEVRRELESDWRLWLYHFYGQHLRKSDGSEVPFAQHHADFWNAFWQIKRGRLPRIAGATRNSIFCVWPRGHGKALDLDTPIPTPSGWTTMGALGVGDIVFDHAGRQTTVIAKSDVQQRESARVHFSDGTSLVASVDHLWSVLGRVERREMPEGVDWATDSWGIRSRGACSVDDCDSPTRKRGMCSAHLERLRRGGDMAVPVKRHRQGHSRTAEYRASVMTTADLVQSGLRAGSERAWAIPVAGALDTEPVPSEIDPYLLGVWLGDGTSAAGQVTSSFDDAEEMGELITSASGRAVTLHRRPAAIMIQVEGLYRLLRLRRLLGNKRIPPRMLRAGREQRLALLQGLLDTDGSVSTGRSAEFTSTNEAIALSTAELARSLGYRVRVMEGRATLNGVDCGPKWRLHIAGVGPEVFRLERKRMAIARQIEKANHNTGHVVYIERIEPVGIRSVQCITVDSPGHLYLAGEGMTPTHNSTSIEMAVASAAAREVRKYALYVSASQDMADGHVANVSSLLLGDRFQQIYPEAGDRRVGKIQRGAWRHNRLQTASGFTIDAVGLDKGIRGVKDEAQRPDLIILDDIDDINDSGVMTDRKMRTLSRSIIPTGSADCMIVMVQNLVLEDGIMDRLIQGRADFLRGAYVSGPHPAITGLQYEGRPDGTWAVVGGVPTWDGFDVADIEAAMNRVGPAAFLAEYQHELSGVSDRVHPNFSPATHAYLSKGLPKFVQMVGGLDFGGEGKTANETAGVVGGVEQTDRVLLVDEFKDNGVNVDQRLYEWMRIQEMKWLGPGSITWFADGTESLGIRAMRNAGFNVIASRLGGRVPLREFRARLVGRQLAMDGAGIPGLRYLPRLRRWESEILRYRRQKPSFDGDTRRRDIIQVDDHLMTATEYMMDGLFGPQAERSDTRHGEHADYAEVLR